MVTRISSILFALTLLFFMTAPTANAVSSNDDVTNSKHNLSSSQSDSTWNQTGQDRICVFCHTPHGGGAGEHGVEPPLWNKNMDVTVAYTTHGMSREANSGPGSISLACLQCHDGTQAMDVMINAPGSGLGSASGVGGAAFVWSGDNVNTEGYLAAGVVTNLGTDLRNDHPISIMYAYGTCSDSGTAYNASSACTAAGMAPGFKQPTTRMDGSAGMDMPPMWSFGMTGNSIKLVTREADEFNTTGTPADGADHVASVECSSCHNPHIGTTTGDVVSTMFLRIANNQNSEICLSCHAK